jgi:carbon-monoxide dehydrogenase small subunit
MIMTGIDLVNTASRDNVELGEAEIREGLKGNYCRCTGYQNIVRAVATAAQQMED